MLPDIYNHLYNVKGKLKKNQTINDLNLKLKAGVRVLKLTF